MIDTVYLDSERLLRLLVALFGANGCAASEAGDIAAHLIEADLQGHPSHGVGLVPTYIANIRAGEVMPNRLPERVPVDGGFLLYDGGRGFGQSVGRRFVANIVAGAAESGIAIFGLRRVHHLGRIGDYGERFAKAGYVSVMFVNTVSRPIVAPFGGREARMGTNPICITVPRPGHAPIVLDFATSAIAVGKCRVALEKGRPIPAGMALDSTGQPTTDPRALYTSPQGALMAMGGYKGSGMNLICELLSACVGGLTMTDARPGSGSAVNNLLGMCFRASVVPSASEGVESVVSYYLATLPASDVGPVRLPGDPEREALAVGRSKGVPLAPATWQAIADLAIAARVPVGDIESVSIGGSGA